MPETLTVIETPVGPGRVHLIRPKDSRGVLALGHGAGGSQWTKDILAIREAALQEHWAVALIEQPWRVAGKKIAARPPVLDQAWIPMLAALPVQGEDPLVVGGRSAGARVACRTAAEVGADAVLCLSFPLHPPGKPQASRAAELRMPLDLKLPVCVIQGRTDPFGTPAEVRAEVGGEVTVTGVPGTHSLPSVAPVVQAGAEFLATVSAQR